MVPELECRHIDGWLRSYFATDEVRIINRLVRGTFARVFLIENLRTQEMFCLKYYEPYLPSHEVVHYRRYREENGLLGDILRVFPSDDSLPAGAILMPCYEEVRCSCTADLLAVMLSLSLLFQRFSEDKSIYFDLKRDCLRIDKDGGLRLIDFTDLLTTQELVGSKLPTSDLRAAPPEGRRYDALVPELGKETPFSWARLRRAALALDPVAYHAYLIGQVGLQFLQCAHGPLNMRDLVRLVAKIDNIGSARLSRTDCIRVAKLLKRLMLTRPARRLKLKAASEELWMILKAKINASSHSDSCPTSAVALLRTVTGEDSLSRDIQATLRRFWNGDSK